MGWIAITATTAICIAIAHHLGLVEKVAEVAMQITACARCSVFWGVLGVLILNGTDIGLSLVASLACAYLTDYFGLFLNALSKMYLRLWRNQNKRNRRNG